MSLTAKLVDLQILTLNIFAPTVAPGMVSTADHKVCYVWLNKDV